MATITIKQIEPLNHNVRDQNFHVCDPPEMVDDVATALKDLGAGNTKS